MSKSSTVTARDRPVPASASGVSEGVITLFSMHTTCSLHLNEFQPALVADVRMCSTARGHGPCG